MTSSTNSAFQQPPVPGYSPWPQARQDTPYLQTPGVQGLQEGVSGGQGLAFTPAQEFFAGGTEGTAPPSSIAPGGSGMWSRYGGSGGAPSSTAQQPGGNNPFNGMGGAPGSGTPGSNPGDLLGIQNLPNIVQALKNPQSADDHNVLMNAF
jgi:hypothetical protein